MSLHIEFIFSFFFRVSFVLFALWGKHAERSSYMTTCNLAREILWQYKNENTKKNKEFIYMLKAFRKIKG